MLAGMPTDIEGLGARRDALECKSNHFRPLLETQVGRFWMKGGSKRLGTRWNWQKERWAGLAWRRDVGLRRRRAMRPWWAGAKTGASKSTSASPGSCCSLWSRHCESSPGIKANHMQCCAVSPQSKPKNSTTFKVGRNKKTLGFALFRLDTKVYVAVIKQTGWLINRKKKKKDFEPLGG